MAAVEAPQTRTILLEESLVAPQADEEQTLPLTFFDMPWIHFPAMQYLMFFEFPCSKSRFLETVIPSLKNSLSKTLKHFLPLSGNLYYPYPTHEDTISNNIPEIRYKPGDSVSITVAEYSGEDGFDYLAGNSPRDCDKFHDLVPDFRDPRIEGNNTLLPLTAVQITLFPGDGISIGIINNHSVCDFSSMSRFFQAWGKVAASKEEDDDDVIAKNDSLPIFDRSVVKDPNGTGLSICNAMKQRKYQIPNSKIRTRKLRATFTFSKEDIEGLKALARSEKPDIAHISSLTVTTAYVWTCLARSASESDGKLLDGEEEHLIVPIDVRSRVDPPVPANYFGNFIRPAFSQTTHGQLKGEKGFPHAAEVIGNLIGDVVGKRYDLFSGGEKLNDRFRAMAGKRKLSIAGSPRSDLYGVDFGWGRAKKLESVSIDRESSAMSLRRSGECDGGLEICLALEKEAMDAFRRCFHGGLKD